jgi:hypothetical protein
MAGLNSQTSEDIGSLDISPRNFDPNTRKRSNRVILTIYSSVERIPATPGIDFSLIDHH